MRLPALVIGVGLVAAGCDAPSLLTDLDEAGPPRVTSVLVSSESYGGAYAPGYCAEGASMKKSEDYCPPDGSGVPEVDDAPPLGVEVRIVFSKRLHEDIETLIQYEETGVTIGTIRPSGAVSIVCDGEAVEWDGFYDPSGNHLTYPPGPALVAWTEDVPVAAAGSSCTVTLADVIKDRDGVTTPTKGPFAFALAALRVTRTVPANGAAGVVPEVVPSVRFNSVVDAASLAGKVRLELGTALVTATVDLDPANPTIVLVTPDAPLPAGEYTLTVEEGIEDVAGGALGADVTVTFTVGGE